MYKLILFQQHYIRSLINIDDRVTRVYSHMPIALLVCSNKTAICMHRWNTWFAVKRLHFAARYLAAEITTGAIRHVRIHHKGMIPNFDYYFCVLCTPYVPYLVQSWNRSDRGKCLKPSHSAMWETTNWTFIKSL